MKAFLFSASDDPRHKAVTSRADGTNLPPCPAGAWRAEGHVDLDVPGGGVVMPGLQDGLDVAAVREGLERDGYHMLDLGGSDWAGRTSDL